MRTQEDSRTMALIRQRYSDAGEARAAPYHIDVHDGPYLRTTDAQNPQDLRLQDRYIVIYGTLVPSLQELSYAAKRPLRGPHTGSLKGPKERRGI